MKNQKKAGAASRLFPIDLPERQWVAFEAQGFASPVTGVIYRGSNPPGCGMPLGGAGTGCIDLQADGTFGYSTIFGSYVPPGGPLGLPFLGINVDGKTWLLSTKKFKPPTHFIIRTDKKVETAKGIHYWGHYPVVDMEFVMDCPVSVGLRAWSPFLPGDVKSSNVPGATFQVHLRNENGARRKVVIALSIPGPSIEETKGDRLFMHYMTGHPFYGVWVKNGSGIEYSVGGLIPEPHPARAPKIDFGGELGMNENAWALIGEKLPFALSTDSGLSCSQEVILEPGECRVVPLFFAWYSSHWYGGGNALAGGNAYSHMYTSRFHDAKEVGEFLVDTYYSTLRKILAWQEVVYDEKNLPGWLQDVLINSLHLVTETGMWAEAKPPIGDWCKKEDGLWGMNESPRGCPQIECMPCSWLGSMPLVYFFPELALSALRGYKAYQYPSGAPPWIFGGCTGGTAPCEMVYPSPGYQITLNGTSYVDMFDRYWQATGDDEILREFYPSLKRATIYTMTLRSEDGPDGVISMPTGNQGSEGFEFCEWYGMTPKVGGMHLAQLRMMERMAEAVGDGEFAEKCRTWFNGASNSMETKMWADRYYLAAKEESTGRVSDVIFGYQMHGQWMAAFHGLPEVFKPERAKITLETIKNTCVKATPYGAVNFTNADGSPVTEDEYHTGYGWVSFFPTEFVVLAMNYIYDGQKDFGLELARRCYHNVVCRQGMMYDMPNLVRGDTGEITFGNDYYQNLILWCLPAAVAGQDIKASSAPGGLVSRIIAAARDT